ncbi:hypothetical protein EDB85DRAFT_2076099 [Lactarius pseudohatsudake]|nr:hypothetical protein EDB85DRAFT_2076099 [Lactarius pseudohatsudake]
MASRGSVVLLSLDDMQEAANQHFGFVPCTWQLEAALTQLGQRDLVTLAPTGLGKALTFWIPLLFNEDGITIIITLLIVLGEKNVNELLNVSIMVINLTTTSAFVNKLQSFIFNEAHCISQWSGDFQPDYANVGRLRWMVPARVIFYTALATMPCYVLLAHVKSLLQMCSDTREIRLTNDHPNIHLTTLEMLDPLNLSHDITHMLRFDGDPPPPLFMILAYVCMLTCSLVPADSVDKLWFHSGMSTDF